jgi:hypothetical protein
MSEPKSWGWVPPKFDPAREVAETADRDSTVPARLSMLYGFMDQWAAGVKGGSLDNDTAAHMMSSYWAEIRELMGEL